MDGQVEMFRHLTDCLRNDTPSLSEGIDGWNVMAVIEAANASARSGQHERVRTRGTAPH